MLRTGTILHGTYRIESYLSSGGFGNTYVATNVEFDERVALKEFFMKGVTQRDSDSLTVSVSNRDNTEQFVEQREKFKKEARRLRKLHNNHLVRVHDLFEENGTAYYVMDYVDGESLSALLKRTGQPLTEAEVWKILPQVLDALRTVHGQGIWHLDLKPGNIMLDKEGTVKVIDFGASKQFNAQKGGATTSTAVSYTRGFAPKEQEAQHYDKFGPWTDLYALGATLYNLITNRKPPMYLDIEENGSAAFSFPSGVSSNMRDLIEWLMQPNRMKRPQSVEEVIRCMEQPGQRQTGAKPESEDETVYNYNTKTEQATSTKTESDDKTQYTDNRQDNKNTARAKKDTATDKSSEPKRNSKKWWVIGIGAAVLCGVIALVAVNSGNEQQAQESASEQSEVQSEPVAVEGSKTFTANGVDFTMVLVNGGTFQMGSTTGDSDEKPVHSVTLSSYYIGQTEVTQALWKAVMGSNPCKYDIGDNRPVQNVSWNDCQTFIQKLNQLTGERFRLPTEAEWEYAAKGGNRSKGYTYSGSNSIDNVAWYTDNSSRESHPVATKAPNELGIYDMTGNVWEWCQDWEGDYSSSAQSNPSGPSSGFFRVLRGGCWDNNATDCRTANRYRGTPTSAGILLGLRLAR